MSCLCLKFCSYIIFVQVVSFKYCIFLFLFFISFILFYFIFYFLCWAQGPSNPKSRPIIKAQVRSKSKLPSQAGQGPSAQPPTQQAIPARFPMKACYAQFLCMHGMHAQAIFPLYASFSFAHLPWLNPTPQLPHLQTRTSRTSAPSLHPPSIPHITSVSQPACRPSP